MYRHTHFRTFSFVWYLLNSYLTMGAFYCKIKKQTNDVLVCYRKESSRIIYFMLIADLREQFKLFRYSR